MITHIEIDGFKSFVGFEFDVPPFLALLGANASGKSNLVDALRAMVEFADGGAFTSLYAAGRGTPAEMFHQREDSSRVRLARIKCELIADAHEIGGFVGLDYFVEVGHDVLPRGERVTPRTVAVSEWTPGQLSALRARGAHGELVTELAGTARRLPTGEQPSDISGLTPAALYGAPFEGMLDGRQRAMWLLAREVRGWQFLSLAPGGVRERALVTDSDPLALDGGNLAAVLGRISGTDAMWDLVADAVALIPGLRDVHVTQGKEYWEYELEFRGTGRISPRVTSDGTLRALAILAALHDPDYPGVLVLDEIENGLHPARLTELLKRIRARVTDWRASAELLRPLRQVIFTTHSPVVLASLWPEHRDDLAFLSAHVRPWTLEERKVGSLVTRARSIGEPDKQGTHVTSGEVRRLLETAQPMEQVP